MYFSQKSKLDDVFVSILDQLLTETNLYRKAECFDFTTQIIEMHGIHCVKNNLFKDIVCDNLDICSNEGVYEILVEHVLKVSYNTYMNFIEIKLEFN